MEGLIGSLKWNKTKWNLNAVLSHTCFTTQLCNNYGHRAHRPCRVHRTRTTQTCTCTVDDMQQLKFHIMIHLRVGFPLDVHWLIISFLMHTYSIRLISEALVCPFHTEQPHTYSGVYGGRRHSGQKVDNSVLSQSLPQPNPTQRHRTLLQSGDAGG